MHEELAVKQMLAPRFSRVGALVLAAGLASACTDTSGIGSQGQVTVTMQQTSDGIVAQTANGWYASVTGGERVFIDKHDVESLVVTVTEIQFLPKNESGDDDAMWESLLIERAVDLDLMALPTEGDSPIVIASGEVEVGDYRMVRLFVGDATIMLNTAISLGQAITFDAGEPGHEVMIPSGTETGIKTDAEFSVIADTDVNLLFDPASTFLNVTATGNGQVILAPVIRALVTE